MRLDDNRVIYSDDRHNAFTSLVRWHDRYWLAFRNATHHRSHDGRIMVISSPDLEHWSAPAVALDTPDDDRDPRLVVLGDRLFVSSLTVARRFADERHLDGAIHTTRLQGFMTATDDGATWEEPWVTTEPDHCIWWMMREGDQLYATERKIRRVVENGTEQRDYQTNFLTSANGREWERIAVVSTVRLSSECSFTFLPDGRAVGFLRHDADQHPEIVVASPPYRDWHREIAIPFMYSGPCLGLVGETIVIAGRAFFEDPATPLLDPALLSRQRGLLVMTVDLALRDVTPHLLLPHATGPLGADDPGADEDARFNAPDISYASIVDLGQGRFAMSYYEGYKGHRSNIRLARLRLSTEA
jgi:hypothetical protein